jgi:HK97 gp10 family phage protein
MARFDTSGFDDVINALTALDLTDDETDDVLLAGAEEVKEAWKQSAEKHELRDTGDMINSIDYSRKPKKAAGIREVDIYPQGKDRKGIRNAEKAFVLHYGTSRIPATHWVDEADEMAAEPVQKAMEEKYDEILRKRGMK